MLFLFLTVLQSIGALRAFRYSLKGFTNLNLHNDSQKQVFLLASVFAMSFTDEQSQAQIASHCPEVTKRGSGAAEF